MGAPSPRGTQETLGGHDRSPATIRLGPPTALGAEQLPESSTGLLRVDHDHVQIAGADPAYLGASWTGRETADLTCRA